MKKTLEQLKDLIVLGQLVDFTLKLDNYIVKVTTDKQPSEYSGQYFVHVQYKNFRDIDNVYTSEEVYMKLIEYVDFIESIKEDPEAYREKATKDTPWVHDTVIQRTIDEIVNC